MLNFLSFGFSALFVSNGEIECRALFFKNVFPVPKWEDFNRSECEMCMCKMGVNTILKTLRFFSVVTTFFTLVKYLFY